MANGRPLADGRWRVAELSLSCFTSGVQLYAYTYKCTYIGCSWTVEFLCITGTLDHVWKISAMVAALAGGKGECSHLPLVRTAFGYWGTTLAMKFPTSAANSSIAKQALYTLEVTFFNMCLAQSLWMWFLSWQFASVAASYTELYHLAGQMV